MGFGVLAILFVSRTASSIVPLLGLLKSPIIAFYKRLSSCSSDTIFAIELKTEDTTCLFTSSSFSAPLLLSREITIIS